MKFVLRVLKEPLLHFLVLAAGLFALSRAFSETPEAEDPDTIVVSEQRIISLSLKFQRTWQRPPTREELDGLIEDYIKEEVFYREALAMGLDRDDTLIRRRMRQKLEFVAEDLADAVEPTDEQLQEFLDEHPDSYRVERRVTFSQVYLSRDRRGDSLATDAQQLLAELRTGDLDPLEAGDPSLLPPFHENLREGEIPHLFGREFAPGLLTAELNQWSGPIESAYGVHLVMVHAKSEGRLPKLDEVRAAVRRDWYAERRVTSKDEFSKKLREKYTVVVEEVDFDREEDSSTSP